MNPLFETLVVAGMFLVRLGVPLVITLAIAHALRWLDIRWQAEAVKARETAQALLQEPCWAHRGCTQERRSLCPAFQRPDLPCWAARRLREGQLPAECYNCRRFALGQIVYGATG
ncbi:MAG: hypothetical protein RML36_03340 [Anaerolineae bacterium]|nr:hypothetical protein [Anaerolineae bacterium]MDW8098503.1 hypothetical protein [Anaerolineae bacterium]